MDWILLVGALFCFAVLALWAVDKPKPSGKPSRAIHVNDAEVDTDADALLRGSRDAAREVVAELVIDADVDRGAVASTLIKHQNSGKGVGALMTILPTGRWHWPRWIPYAEADCQVAKEELRQDIEELTDTEFLSGHFKKAEIAAQLRAQLGKPPPSKAKKHELVAAFLDAARPEDIAALRAAKTEEEVADIKPCEREMAGAVYARFVHLAHSKYRRHQLADPDLRIAAPIWLLRAGDAPACHCTRHDGCARRWDDPFWDEHSVPCESPHCTAYIIAISVAHAKRQGYVVASDA